jgi:hypothetical protein
MRPQPLEHARQGLAARQEGPGEMHGEHVVEVPVGHHEEQAVAGEPGGVDEDVDDAEAPEEGRDRRGRGRVARLEGDREALAPRVFCPSGRGVGAVRVRGRHLQAVAGEGLRDREAEPAAAAGDERASRRRTDSGRRPGHGANYTG